MQTFTRGRSGDRALATNLNTNFDEVGKVASVAAATADATVSVPAGYRIVSIDIFNSTANAVTGGIKIGTTAGGTEVVVAQAVGANALVSVPDASILLKAFSTTAEQTLYVRAVTAWNSANLNVRVALRKVF